MNRRDFIKTAGMMMAAAAAGTVPPMQAQAAEDRPGDGREEDIHAAIPAGPPQHIAMLLYPSFILLDLFGPHAILAALGNIQVHLVWKTREAVASSNGIAIAPTTTFEECPDKVGVLFVPGGLEGGNTIMTDPVVMAFLQSRGEQATYVTSVCTGSLILGAAGLLRGYRATSHWTVRHLLPLLGAEPVPGRVVEDRNRLTGGGVTAGIDFGLHVAARMRGESYAKMLQLAFEYDPQPPFHAGSPETAGRMLVDHMKERRAPVVEAARRAAVEAARRLNL